MATFVCQGAVYAVARGTAVAGVGWGDCFSSIYYGDAIVAGLAHTGVGSAAIVTRLGASNGGDRVVASLTNAGVSSAAIVRRRSSTSYGFIGWI